MPDPPVLRVDAVAWPLASETLAVGDLECLSPEERARASAIRHPAVAARFVAGRAGVRSLLAPLLGCAPAAVPLRLEPDGRPVVNLPILLPFSISHTRHTVVVAYASQGATDTTRLGIDVEDTARQVDQQAITKRALRPDDWRQWCALPDAPRADAFWRLWTTKEAVLKAVGAHVPGGLLATRVDLAAPTRLLASPVLDPPDVRWRTHAWSPWADAWVTVAVRHAGPVLLVLRRAPPDQRTTSE